jgi:hypothetical protein
VYNRLRFSTNHRAGTSLPGAVRQVDRFGPNKADMSRLQAHRERRDSGEHSTLKPGARDSVHDPEESHPAMHRKSMPQRNEGHRSEPLPSVRRLSVMRGFYGLPKTAYGRCTGWLVLAIAMLLALSQLSGVVIPEDEGMLLTYPWLMARGSMLYRDIWTTYPPATFFALAGLAKLGLAGLPVERGLGVLARILYVLLINRAITGSWRRIAWFPIALTFTLLFFVDVNMRAYPWVVGTPLLVSGLLAARAHPRLAVALLTLAGLTRVEFGLAGATTLAVLAVLNVRRPVWRRTYAGPVLALVLCSAGIYGLLDLQTGGQALVDVVSDPFRGTNFWPRPALFPPNYGIVGIPVIIAAVLLPVGLMFLGAACRKPYIVATNIAMLTLIPHFFQYPDGSHLFSLASIDIPWALICLQGLSGTEDALDARPRARVPLDGLIMLAGAWSILVVLSYSVYFSPISPISAQRLTRLGDRAVWAGSRTIFENSPVDAQSDRRIMAYVDRHVPANARIIILPVHVGSLFTRTDMYYELQRRPATKYLMLLGLIAHAGGYRDLERDLRSCPWLVLIRGGPWYNPTPATFLGGGVEKYIEKSFVTVLRTPTYVIEHRRHPGP